MSFLELPHEFIDFIHADHRRCVPFTDMVIMKIVFCSHSVDLDLKRLNGRISIWSTSYCSWPPQLRI